MQALAAYFIFLLRCCGGTSNDSRRCDSARGCRFAVFCNCFLRASSCFESADREFLKVIRAIERGVAHPINFAIHSPRTCC